MGYEIAEQLGWRTPHVVVAPMAGGSLIGKIHKSFNELYKIGLLKDQPRTKILRSPGDRLQSDHRRRQEQPRAASSPVRKPNTIAKSLAIGDPADGYFAAKVMRDTGGWGEDVNDLRNRRGR